MGSSAKPSGSWCHAPRRGMPVYSEIIYRSLQAMKSIPLELKTRDVFFSQIDWADTRFSITYGRPLTSMIRSMGVIGLANPAVLQENTKGQFRIVAGARRLRALQKIG
ncbi:MAG: hypothetical protein C0407_13170, partial [Desulfobacca sp.]|nr:hypothetical protein [Desulfobacca sp.]